MAQYYDDDWRADRGLHSSEKLIPLHRFTHALAGLSKEDRSQVIDLAPALGR
jgi:hypothetical protein